MFRVFRGHTREPAVGRELFERHPRYLTEALADVLQSAGCVGLPDAEWYRLTDRAVVRLSAHEGCPARLALDELPAIELGLPEASLEVGYPARALRDVPDEDWYERRRRGGYGHVDDKRCVERLARGQRFDDRERR